MWWRVAEEGSRAGFGEIVEEASDVIAVLTNAFAESLDFDGLVVDFTSSVDQVAVQRRDELL